jgi:hypothetical protein
MYHIKFNKFLKHKNPLKKNNSKKDINIIEKSKNNECSSDEEDEPKLKKVISKIKALKFKF